MTTFEVGLNRGGREAIGVTPKSSKTMQNSSEEHTHIYIYIYIDQPANFFL